MKPQFKPTSIDNLATSLCNSLQNIINLPQQQADIKQYIVTLNTPSPGQAGISEDNYKKIYKLSDFTIYLNGVNRAINHNCEWKWNDKIKTSIINNYSKHNNPISDFMDYIVNKGCNDLEQALNVLATNNYIPSIKDTLEIEDDVINKFFNEDTNDLANKFAYLIDFVYNKEKDAKNYKSQKNKDDLQCNLETIKEEIKNVVNNAQQQKISRENVNDLYTNLKNKLNKDLTDVYDINDANGQPITDFSKVQHRFEYHSAEISDKNAEPGNPLNNINHPMRYLLEDLDNRRNLAPDNLGTNAPCKVTVTEDTNGFSTPYDGTPYKMGDGSKVLIENGCSADEITGKFNQAGNGTQMNITHPKDKVISALSFQASINATVESMQNKFGDSNNPNDPVKFALKLNSQSYATCQTMFKELANYARAQYAQQAATQVTPLPKEQIDYNKRFEHFNDIFINGVKLDRDFFTNSANYKDPKNNNQFDEGMFVDAVWNKIESTLQAKQQTSNANGNTQVQLTEQEQILQNIVLQKRATVRP